MAARILVVDDEPDLLELVRLSLAEAGFAVETAATGPASDRIYPGTCRNGIPADRCDRLQRAWRVRARISAPGGSRLPWLPGGSWTSSSDGRWRRRSELEQRVLFRWWWLCVE